MHARITTSSVNFQQNIISVNRAQYNYTLTCRTSSDVHVRLKIILSRSTNGLVWHEAQYIQTFLDFYQIHTEDTYIQRSNQVYSILTQEVSKLVQHWCCHMQSQ